MLRRVAARLIYGPAYCAAKANASSVRLYTRLLRKVLAVLFRSKRAIPITSATASDDTRSRPCSNGVIAS